MTIDDLVTYYQVKNDAQLATVINRARSTVSEWRANGIPWLHQTAFQIETKGKLKAEPKPIPQAS